MSKPRAYFSSIFCLVLLLIQSHFTICNGVSVLELNSLTIGENESLEQKGRSQNVEKCSIDIEMDSEINRRILAMQKRFISYETLKRDMTPCENAGASYYNCHGKRVNPYSRGCEVITGCARGSIRP
ncbi:hypothetical protein UlMin_010495 [Ulmus minor]